MAYPQPPSHCSLLCRQVGKAKYWTKCTGTCDGQCGPGNGCNVGFILHCTRPTLLPCDSLLPIPSSFSSTSLQCGPCHALDVAAGHPGTNMAHMAPGVVATGSQVRKGVCILYRWINRYEHALATLLTGPQFSGKTHLPWLRQSDALLRGAGVIGGGEGVGE